MTATVTKINPDIIQEASIPDVLSKMETADTTFVLHIRGGRWDMQVVKGKTDVWRVIGIFQSLVTHFSNVANGAVSLKK